MGKFNGKISAEFTPPKTWKLERTLSFQTDDLTADEIKCLKIIGVNIVETGRITCKKGMKTDLASVPRIVWNIIAPWDVAREAVIHDHLYATLRNYYNTVVRKAGKVSRGRPHCSKSEYKLIWEKARALSDKVFLLGMDAAEPSISGWKKKSAYYSVRIFGRWNASSKE